MAETQYSGSCHCGEVKYDVTLELGDVISCNCSICSRKGYLLAFAPVDKFQLRSGSGNLIDYQFNKKSIHHFFCSKCGVTSFADGALPDGTKMIAINVRCLDGVDLDSLKIKKFDGKHM